MKAVPDTNVSKSIEGFFFDKREKILLFKSKKYNNYIEKFRNLNDKKE
jgi:hypothetical protein